jgi:hypothetical protein
MLTECELRSLDTRSAWCAGGLACGQATVEYIPYGCRVRETPVTGNEWVPACIAVARLRRAVFGAPPFWQRGHFFANEIGEDDDA